MRLSAYLSCLIFRQSDKLCVYRRRCREQTKEFNLAIQDRTGFADTLERDIAKFKIALEKEPWLMNDFQAIIDPEGYVHLFDLTRPCLGSICANKTSVEIFEILNGLRDRKC